MIFFYKCYRSKFRCNICHANSATITWELNFSFRRFYLNEILKLMQYSYCIDLIGVLKIWTCAMEYLSHLSIK